MVIAAVILILGMLALFVWQTTGPKPARIPEIPSAALSADTANLISKYREAVRQAPGSGLKWGQLGGVLKSSGFPTQAATCLAEAARLEPDNPRWPYLQATLQTDDSAAIAHLQRAVQLCQNTPEYPRLLLARRLTEANQEKEARRHAEELLQARPDCLPARLLLAQLSQAKGNWTEALQLATPCLSNSHTARAAWTLVALAQGQLGDTNAAQFASFRAAGLPADVPWPDPFEQEVLLWRNDPRSISDRAQQYLVAGRIDAAQPLIDQLFRDHPGFSESWLLLGRAQYLQKQPAAAEATLQRYLQIDPQSANGHFQLGMSRLALGNFEGAISAFQDAIRYKPNFGPAYFNLGFALTRTGRAGEAIAPFREAIRHNPEFPDAYILLADLLVQRGELDEAARLADTAARLNPNHRGLPPLRQKIGKR
jgi:tetratricopeptide (TPR) repeat protein